MTVRISNTKLVECHTAMLDERRNWMIDAQKAKPKAVRAGRYAFDEFEFDTIRDADAFITRRCLAEGLKKIGIEVDAVISGRYTGRHL